MKLLFINHIISGNYSTALMEFFGVMLLWLIIVVSAFVDLKTGIDASKASGCFRTTSSGLRKTLKKISDYIMIMIIALLFDVATSYLVLISDVFPVLSIFRVPLVSMAATAFIIYIEGVSVKENVEKRKGGKIVSPEATNELLKIIEVLGDEKVKALAKLLREDGVKK